MKKIYLLPLFLLLTSLGFSQKNSEIIGSVNDSTDLSIVGASAILYFQKDSIFTGFALTDDQGRFSINNVAPDNYYLQISYVGYHPTNKTINKEDFDGEVDLGLISIKSNTDLEAVVVTNAPLELRKDTIIYDATAFQTQANATVEDLLKQLPGIEVEDDGSITAQGEQVQQVLVDGKRFFGDDPKVATQNLPADAIKNVEVFDKRSEKAEFTGVDDGNEEKTINLELKADRKNGYFGNVSAAGGIETNQDEGVYAGKGILSRYSPGNQISVIASSNNINDQAFTARDYFSLSGQNVGRGRSISIGGGAGSLLNNRLNSGINTSTVTGANWNTTFGEKLDFHADYFYNRQQNNFVRNITREFFQTVGDLDYVEDNNGEDLSNNHRLNFDLTANLNKRNELKFENQFIYAETDGQQFLTSETLNPIGELTNSNETSQETIGDNFSFLSDVFWKHRFSKKGRSLFANFGLRNTATDQNTFTDANTFLGAQGITLLNQNLDNNYDVATWIGDLSYTEPLWEDNYLEINYIITNENEESKQRFIDLDANGVGTLNNELSNAFDRDYIINRPGLNYKIVKEKHNLTFGANYEFANLDGLSSLSPDLIDRDFNQFLPSFNWDYDITDGKSLALNYRSSQNAPSVTQLQPSLINTNPLNLYQGNPNLEAEVNHNINTRFFSFDRFSFTSLFANLSFNRTVNNIVNSQTFDQNLVQTTQPVNVDGQTRLNGSVRFGKPIRSIRMRLRTTLSSSFTDGILFLNGQENDFDRWTNSLRISFDNTNEEVVDYSFGVRLSDNSTTYSQSERNNQDFLNQFYDAEVEYRGIDNWRASTEMNYRIFGAPTPTSEVQEFPIWGAELSHLFADNLGEVKLSVVDILNRNTGISQTQSLNFTQQEISNALGRYATIGLTWKILDKAGKQDKSQANSERTPRERPQGDQGGKRPNSSNDSPPPPPR